LDFNIGFGQQRDNTQSFQHAFNAT
jgi:hypothetical protein